MGNTEKKPVAPPPSPPQRSLRNKEHEREKETTNSRKIRNERGDGKRRSGSRHRHAASRRFHGRPLLMSGSIAMLFFFFRLLHKPRITSTETDTNTHTFGQGKEPVEKRHERTAKTLRGSATHLMGQQQRRQRSRQREVNKENGNRTSTMKKKKKRWSGERAACHDMKGVRAGVMKKCVASSPQRIRSTKPYGEYTASLERHTST